MPAFRTVNVAEVPYLYVDRRTTMAPEEISAAMGTAFSEVWAFMKKHGVPPAGVALAVYTEYCEGEMPFRAGFSVAREDMGAVADGIAADVTPAGKVLHFTHRGSYATLRDDWEAMMEHMQAEGLRYAPPTWEVYLNSPDEVHEEQLLTECYQMLG